MVIAQRQRMRTKKHGDFHTLDSEQFTNNSKQPNIAAHWLEMLLMGTRILNHWSLRVRLHMARLTCWPRSCMTKNSANPSSAWLSCACASPDANALDQKPANAASSVHPHRELEGPRPRRQKEKKTPRDADPTRGRRLFREDI